MKPIRMRIKGLNSFLEAQDIDFEQLTSHGLFGIFGPTGSGKSSILDGITIALYGATSRNSTNYVNVNTDRASVEYTFSVREKRSIFIAFPEVLNAQKKAASEVTGQNL